MLCAEDVLLGNLSQACDTPEVKDNGLSLLVPIEELSLYMKVSLVCPKVESVCVSAEHKANAYNGFLFTFLPRKRYLEFKINQNVTSSEQRWSHSVSPYSTYPTATVICIGSSGCDCNGTMK